MKISSLITSFVAVACLLMPGSASAWYYYDYSYYYPQSTYQYQLYQCSGYYSYSPCPQQQYYYPTYYYYPATSYGGSSTPSPYNYSYPTGDTDTFGSDICYWQGHGRGLCDFNPRQPVYDHWTGTWY